MSWIDIFYPDNARKREECIANIQKLKDLVENNFEATNKLIEVLNIHLRDTHIEEATRDNDATLKKNCDVLQKKVREIHDVLEEKYAQIKDLLDPGTLKTLDDPKLGIDERFQAVLATVSDSVIGVVGTGVGVATVYCIRTGMILVEMVEAIGVIGSCTIALAGLAILGLGIDMIFSAIYGAIERDKLEAALDELHRELRVYKPAAEKFIDTIYLIRVQIEKMQY